MSVTVNGKTLSEIAFGLEAALPEDAFKSLSYRDDQYLKVETVEDRLNEVVGRMNYDLEYSEPQVVEPVREKMSIIMGCTFTLYSDERERILKRSAYSAADVIFTSDGSISDGGLKQCIGTAQSNAFKRMAASLGVGIEQLRERNENASHKSRGSGRTSTQIRVSFDSMAKRYGSVLKADCVNVDTGERTFFTMFKKSFPAIESAFGSVENFCNNIRPGAVYEFLGHSDRDPSGNPQVVFDSLLT